VITKPERYACDEGAVTGRSNASAGRKSEIGVLRAQHVLIILERHRRIDIGVPIAPVDMGIDLQRVCT